MPSAKREKTKYPGVFSIVGKHPTGKPEKIYYIRYRRQGKLVEEKAGGQYRDAMTAAKAANIRAQRMDGKMASNEERREAERAAKAEAEGKWTIDRLWEAYKATRPVGKSLKTDEGRYEKYIRPAFGDKEPHEIDPLSLDRLRVQMLKTKSPQTVKHVLNLLTWTVNFGVKRGLSAPLPFHIRKPEVHNEKTEDLTEPQLRRLLEVLYSDSNRQVANFMLMILFTGMRRGELIKLTWPDVDFDRGFIYIRDPKGGPSQKIPLNQQARDLLMNHPRSENDLYVFPGRDGGQRAQVSPQARKIAQKAGLPPDFRPCHGLRHVYASMMASTGQVDLYTLQRLLTHKTPRMTQRYAHLRDEALRKAASVAGQIVTNYTSGQSETGKVVGLNDQKEHISE